MHALVERRALVQKVFRFAEKMVSSLPPSHSAYGKEITDFLRRHACIGCPDKKAGAFGLGQWLTREGRPESQFDAVTIIPCWSSEVAPISPPSTYDAVAPGVTNAHAQVIILYAVDRWSVPELALTLLHEGRHARHRLGTKLGGLIPLDADAMHESNTWMVTANILQAWGGNLLKSAVYHEIKWLEKHASEAPAVGQIAPCASNQYWPQLDYLFGHTDYSEVRMVRQALVSLLANAVFWPRQNPSINETQVFHTLVSEFNR